MGLGVIARSPGMRTAARDWGAALDSIGAGAMKETSVTWVIHSVPIRGICAKLRHCNQH